MEMNWDGWNQIMRGSKKPILNSSQKKLLAICFGGDVPDANTLMDLRRNEKMTRDCLRRMARMTLIEFSKSIHKERWKQAVLENREPKAFDVFVMDASASRRNKREYLAVVLPIKKSARVMWYDGGTSLRALDELKYKGRIANIAGPARVLHTLPAESGNDDPDLLGLSLLAMERSKLIEPPRNWEKVLEPHERFVSHLNDSQKQAVATVMSPSFQTGFFVVQGPPGCGKTSTMVAMISAIKDGVLVVTPSNAALANIALKIHSTRQYDLKEMIVFGRNSDPSVHFLNPLNRGEKFREFRSKYEKLKGKPTKQAAILEECKEWFHMKGSEASIDDLGSFCPYINLEVKPGRQKMDNIIAGSKVIFSTLNSSGSGLLKKAKVHTALFDEAGQCSEADFYILTNFSGIERVALVGDPMQLPATVLHQKCKAAGYGESWMKRVHSKYPEKVHLLNTQYRMDPKILVFPNKSFYNSQIQNGSNVTLRTNGAGPKISKPFQWFDTCGRGKEQKVEMSWKNDFEVEAIRHLLQVDGDIQRLLQAEPTARIIIIAPYRSQVKLLQQRVKAPRKTARLDIATVDSFQGQEGDVVIFSTVRSKKLGFIDDANRLNVAITRAKRILRIVGDATFFQSKTGSVLSRLCHHAQGTGSLEKVSEGTAPSLRRGQNKSKNGKGKVSTPYVGLEKSHKRRRRRKRRG